MQYPIIDLIADAYLNNGWTGLDVIQSKNLFTGILSSVNGIDENNNVFTNTGTDTRTFFRFQVQTFLNGSLIRFSDNKDIQSEGVFSLTLNSSRFDTMRIKHNGSTRDLYFDTPINGEGYYTVSINVISYDPTIVGGIVFNDLQIETGRHATPYEPYSPASSDFPNRLKLPLPHYFPHPVIDALQRAAAGTQTADDTEILRHYLTPLGIGGI